MKNTIFIFAFLAMSVFNISMQHKPLGDSPDPEMDAFIADFISAVKSKNQATIMEFMDLEYKLEQHDKLHKGNTTRFLDELFCGNIVDGTGFKCVKIKKIKDLQLAVKGDGKKNIPVVFRVFEKKTKVDVTLTIVIRIENGVRHFGIVGGVG